MSEQERLNYEALRRENRQLKRELSRYRERCDSDGFFIEMLWSTIENFGKFRNLIEYVGDTLDSEVVIDLVRDEQFVNHAPDFCTALDQFMLDYQNYKQKYFVEEVEEND